MPNSKFFQPWRNQGTKSYIFTLPFGPCWTIYRIWRFLVRFILICLPFCHLMQPTKAKVTVSDLRHLCSFQKIKSQHSLESLFGFCPKLVSNTFLQPNIWYFTFFWVYDAQSPSVQLDLISNWTCYILTTEVLADGSKILNN